MLKKIPVNDRQYDWLAARTRRGKTISQVLDYVINLVDRTERDLEKYRKWVDASQPKKESSHETLSLE